VIDQDRQGAAERRIVKLIMIRRIDGGIREPADDPIEWHLADPMKNGARDPTRFRRRG
jgi:hypothetical protein